MNRKIVYTTHWVARDKQKEYPHGWGFDAPIVEFAQDTDPATVSKVCREKLSNEEFECIGATPRGCLSFESPAPPSVSGQLVEQLIDANPYKTGEDTEGAYYAGWENCITKLRELIEAQRENDWIYVKETPPIWYEPVWAEFENGNHAAVWLAENESGLIWTVTGTDCVVEEPLKYKRLSFNSQPVGHNSKGDVGVDKIRQEAQADLLWKLIEENRDADDGQFTKDDIESDLYDWFKKLDLIKSLPSKEVKHEEQDDKAWYSLIELFMTSKEKLLTPEEAVSVAKAIGFNVTKKQTP